MESRIRIFSEHCKSPSRLVALSEARGIPEQIFPPNFVRQDPIVPQELQLLRRLGMDVITRGEYFRTHFLPRAQELFEVHRQAYISTAVLMLGEVGTLTEEDKSFADMLSTLPFLPAGELKEELDVAQESTQSPSVKTLRRPNELFDPANEELRVLLSPAFFPIPELCKDEFLVLLRVAGLRSALDWASIVDCAKAIEFDSKETESSRVARQRGVHLFRFLDKNAGKLLARPLEKGDLATNQAESKQPPPSVSFFRFTSLFAQQSNRKQASQAAIVSGTSSESPPWEAYLKDLMKIKWLPVYTSPLHSCMPWPQGTLSEQVEAPSRCRPADDAWLCSSSCSIATVAAESPLLSSSFGWSKSISARSAALQLRDFVMISRNNVSAGGDKDPSLIEEYLEYSTRVLPAVLPQLYSILNSSLTSESDGADIVEILEDVNWVWVDGEFVSPDYLAFSCLVNASPYLHHVPADMLQYSRLLSIFRIKASFGVEDYIEVIALILFINHYFDYSLNSIPNLLCVIHRIGIYSILF